MSYFKTTSLDTDNMTGDAFARLRVSNPTTLFDSKQIYNNQPLFWDDQETAGGSTTSTYNTNQSSTTIGVAETTAGTRIRQTFRRFNYQPGKSQLILLTGVMNKTGGGTGITRRMGIYDDDNGLFLEDSEGITNVVIRTKTSGSVVENKVAQSSWNVDKLDGTGISGIILDLSKTNIFVIDLEWLGVGRVRMGFNIDGVTHVCHEFLNANNLTEVYMSTPNLPLRYEISNNGTGVASSLQHICGSVMSEGGEQELGIVRYASTNGTHTTATTENLIYAVMGIRLNSSNIGITIKLIKAMVQIQSATDKVEWMLIWNPTVAGTFTYSNETDSAVDIARGVSANTVTNGYKIFGGYIESGNASTGSAGSKDSELDNALILGTSIDGTPDEIVLCVRPIAGASAVDVEGSLIWRELS